MPKLMERHLQIPSGQSCSECPFYQYDTTTEGCNNGMIFSADVTKGKRNAECLKEFPYGGTIWFEQGEAMTDPTICANCKHYTAAIYRYDGPVLIDFPAYCWHKPPNEPKLDYVMGGTAWRVPVRCYKKNLGSCADYEFKPLLTIVQDVPRKHWWQK